MGVYLFGQTVVSLLDQDGYLMVHIDEKDRKLTNLKSCTISLERFVANFEPIESKRKSKV